MSACLPFRVSVCLCRCVWPAHGVNRVHSPPFFAPGEIPDAEFIHLARKWLQMARELGGDAPRWRWMSPRRLVREEEQHGSDNEDEDEKRINFSAVRSKSQRQKIAEEIGGW